MSNYRLHFSQRSLVFLLFVLLAGLLLLLPGGFSTGQDVTSTPAALLPWTTYEDTDPLLLYTGPWQTFPVAGAVGGNLTATDEAGAMLAIYFEGVSIRVLYSSGPEGAPFQGLLDEDWAAYPDSFAPEYSYGHEMVFENLAPGGHILTVTNGEGAIWIEAILVQGELVPPPPILLPITPTPHTTPDLVPATPLMQAQAFRDLASDYTLVEIHTSGELVNTILNVVNAHPTQPYVLAVTPGTYVLNSEQTGYTALPIQGQVTIVNVGGLTWDGFSLYPSQVADWAIFTKTTGEHDLFHVQAGATLTLYNVAIREGGGPNRFSGGGIVNDGNLYLYNSRVLSNRSGYYGGGMHNNGTALIVNSEFVSNKAIDEKDRTGGAGSAIVNYSNATLHAYCTTFETNLVNPTIQGGSSYVPFTIPGGAIYNQSANISVHYSNFIANAAQGQNTYCSSWPQYGFCPLHIRDFASTVAVSASNNYWSNLDDKAIWGSVTTSPTLLTRVEYGAYSGYGQPCYVPPPPAVPNLPTPTPTPFVTPTPGSVTPTPEPLGYVYVPCEGPSATGRSGPATYYTPVFSYLPGSVLPYYATETTSVTWYMVTEETADPQSWVMEGDVVPTDNDHPDLPCGAMTLTPMPTSTPEYTATSEETPTLLPTCVPEVWGSATPVSTPEFELLGVLSAGESDDVLVPPACIIPDSTLIPTNTPRTPTATATTTATCEATVVGPSAVNLRDQPNTTTAHIYLAVDSNMQVKDSNISTIPNGEAVRIEALFWYGVDGEGTTWLQVRVVPSNPLLSQEGYMALRTAQATLLSVPCEDSLPHLPQPTPQPTATSVPESHIWWVTSHNLQDCTNPPCGLNVYADPDANPDSIIRDSNGKVLLALSCTSVVRVDLNEYTDNPAIPRAKIIWPPSSGEIGYIAIRDAAFPNDGDYLVPDYEQTTGDGKTYCPSEQPVPTATPLPTSTPMPTPTPDPNALFFDRGPFTEIDTAWTFTNQPAQVGAEGVHDHGTLDIMPRNFPDGRLVADHNLEYCIDVLPNNRQSECDPQDGIGYEVLAPIGGSPIPDAVTLHNTTIVIGGYNQYNLVLGGQPFTYIMRMEISLSRLVPSSRISGPVVRGDPLGRLCTTSNLADCDLAGNIVHLAYEVRFRFQNPQGGHNYFGGRFLRNQCTALGFLSNSSECNAIIRDWDRLVRAVIAHPSCLINDWNNDPANPENTFETIVCSQ